MSEPTRTDEQKFELQKLELEHKFQEWKLNREHALEKEKADRQTLLDARHEYARQVLEYALQYERHLKEYGQMALRSVFLLNAGAVIALMTFIGSSVGKSVGTTAVLPSAFVSAFSLYCAGMVAAIGSMLFAYLNYINHHVSSADPGALANNMVGGSDKWPGNFTEQTSRRIDWTWKIALVFGVSSLLFFIAGSTAVVIVFRGMK